jgi:predicted GNAT family N-acyltransferase
MNPVSEFSISRADWQLHGPALSQIRFAVFVREQGVPAEIEMEARDANSSLCLHVKAQNDTGSIIGTGRLLLDSPVPRIGRMAVLRAWRGQGVGTEILEALCDEATARGYAEVLLHAQIHATAFYFKHGFLSHGVEFIEAGIPHQEMRRKLVV